MASHDHAHHGAHHVSPIETYIAVFGTLLFFTAVTYAVSFANLGPFALPIAMLVAFCKAGLVATYFMHLRYDERFNLVVFGSSLFFVAIFAFFTLVDLGSRGLIVPEESPYYFAEQQARAEAAAAAASAPAEPAAEEAPAAADGADHGAAGH
jgi:cytochrome c oxidase subunit 4